MRAIESVRPYVQIEPSRAILPALNAAPRRVLHAIGELSESVLRFLIPAADALDRSGARQHVLVLKDGGYREELERHLPPGISVTVDWRGSGILRRGSEWLAAFRDIQPGGALDVVHLHGATALRLLATADGISAARRLVYSPSGAWDRKPSPHWRAAALLTPPIRKPPHALVMSFCYGTDRGVAELLPDHRVMVCPPLPQAFLQLNRPPVAQTPLVLAAAMGNSRRAAMALAQLGVLAAHGTVDAPVFQWSGKCDAAAARILVAAGVLIHRDDDPSARAARLARAAVFVNAGPDHGYPWHVAEAMACGVPVVALDTPNSRHLVIDGVTGFLCGTVEDMLAQLNTLIKRPELRQRLGNAARLRVQEKFSRETFARHLMEAYGLVPAAPDLPAASNGNAAAPAAARAEGTT